MLQTILSAWHKFLNRQKSNRNLTTELPRINSKKTQSYLIGTAFRHELEKDEILSAYNTDTFYVF